MREQKIETLSRLSPAQKIALKKMGLETLLDLLYHFPARYGDISERKNINVLETGRAAVVFGKISGLKISKAFRKKIPMAEGTIEDETGKIKAVWFNQPYIAKMIGESTFVRVEGKVSQRRKTGELYFSNPKIEKVTKLPVAAGDSLFGAEGEPHHLYPIYPESRGITSNWIYHTIQKLLTAGILESVTDPLPPEILAKYNLPTLKTAHIWIHAPKKKEDALAARKRFAFEEVFFIQIQKQKEKREYQSWDAFQIDKGEAHIKEFVSRFPFSLTGAQERAIQDILADFKKGFAMSRLLQGDVGSGKTAVAAATAYAVVTSPPKDSAFGNLGVAYMAPTEILATQHFESFIQYFRHLPINIGLITGSGCRKFPSKANPHSWTDISRAQLLRWVANGEIPILIGTHALIQKSVRFKHLAYVIIDEQHRFGVNQRQALTKKEKVVPHLLSMTATPIPRTLALTMYGDLDLTILDEQPPGRKAIITEIVLPNERQNMYDKIRTELRADRQTFVICPRIDEPDPTKKLALIAKSVKEEAKRLKTKVFQEFEVGILHGKMTPAEKDKTMKLFNAGHINILVSTSVVEVGINVPNATVIVIEGAERFGLAQLHQLRGRVLRSNHQAYCFVLTETTSGKSIERLRALKTAKNGFELAELDLKFRGAGALSSGKQWGISDLGMEALQNLKMVEAARTEARNIIERDHELSEFPKLKEKISRQAQIHFE